MATTIRDETGLPAGYTGHAVRYLRSKSDPRFMLHPMSGVAYVRHDGQPWQHGGYKVTLEENGTATREIGAAYADNAEYPTAVTA